MEGSRGAYERSGELRIRLRIFPHSLGTFRAALNCANRVSPDENIFIVVAFLSEQSGTYEFVRVRDNVNVSQGTMRLPPEDVDRMDIFDFLDSGTFEGTRIDMRVPIVPRKPPQTIFYGFWLRALQPPGYAQSHITILSNCQHTEANYICQQSLDQGNTGIVHIAPGNLIESSKWSDIRWIKFGFTENYCPILWLANDSQSARLGELFARAVSSRRSEVHFQEHNELMKEDLLRSYEGKALTVDPEISHEWPEGKAVILGHPRRGIWELCVPKLGLKISVLLQPYHSRSAPPSASTDGSGSPMRPTRVWVVDITEEVPISAFENAEETASLPPLRKFICC
jgi:hypothetical protein